MRIASGNVTRPGRCLTTVSEPTVLTQGPHGPGSYLRGLKVIALADLFPDALSRPAHSLVLVRAISCDCLKMSSPSSSRSSSPAVSITTSCSMSLGQQNFL